MLDISLELGKGERVTNLYTVLKGKCLTLCRTNLIHIIRRTNFYFPVNTVNFHYLDYFLGNWSLFFFLKMKWNTQIHCMGDMH